VARDGGRVDPGESLAEAAVREVFEETGVPVRLDGILRIEHTPGDGCRMRVLFTARRSTIPSPRPPDDESLGAAWLTLDEIRTPAVAR
jgi:phosphatase NudJ